MLSYFFYQATKGIDRFRGECKISVWLCQIAKRLWYKELKRRKEVPLSEMTEEIPSFYRGKQKLMKGRAEY